MSPTIHSISRIARAAGVSTATVSRVFNRQPHVREAVRRKVLAVARQLNYQPRILTRRDRVVIVVEGQRGIKLFAYESHMISMLSQVLIQAGLQFDITVIGELDMISTHLAQGAIVLLYEPQSLAHLRAICNLPVLSLAPAPGLPSVTSDHAEAYRLATEHLLQRGHRRIGLITHSTTLAADPERLAGYRRALAQQGLPFTENLIQTDEHQDVLEATAKICRASATALIISGEGRGVQAARALYLLGKRIPEDFSVISYEDPDVTSFLCPAQTAIAQDFERLAELAATQIQALIRGQTKKRINLRVPCRLIERDSVGTLNRR